MIRACSSRLVRCRMTLFSDSVGLGGGEGGRGRGGGDYFSSRLILCRMTFQ